MMTDEYTDTEPAEQETVDALEMFAAPAPLAALHEALAKAQGEFPPIPRDKEVSTGTYTFRYAELGSILGAIRPVLSNNGLAITQPLDAGGIWTQLRHKDGGMLSTFFPFPQTPSSPQALGSLITYLRRYCLVSLLGIASDDDDDAGQAADVKPQPAKEGKPRKISDAQRTRLFAIAKKHGVDEARLRGYVQFYTGSESTQGMTTDQYEQVVRAVETDEEIPF